MIYFNMEAREMLHIEVRKKTVEARKNGLKIREICKAYRIGKTAV